MSDLSTREGKNYQKIKDLQQRVDKLEETVKEMSHFLTLQGPNLDQIVTVINHRITKLEELNKINENINN